jgi:methyl-accepting chemotaxis protein
MDATSIFLNIGYVFALIAGAVSFTWKAASIKSHLDELLSRFERYSERDLKWKEEAETKMSFNSDRIENINTTFTAFMAQISTKLDFIQSFIQEIKQNGSSR